MNLYRYLQAAFSPDAAKTKWSLLAYAFFAVSLNWFVNSTTAWLDAVSPFGKYTLPAALLVAAILVLAVTNRPRPRTSDLAEDVPEPHRGLIVQLSIYNDTSPWSRDKILERINVIATAPDTALRSAQCRELRTMVLASNWGSMWAAAEHHATALEKCVVVCSAEARKDFELAEMLIQTICPKAGVKEAVLSNANSVKDAFAEVSEVYRGEIPNWNMTPGDFIADFTGGTAAMSAGMVMAAMVAGQKLEYLRQEGNRRLANKDGNGDWQARSEEDIRTARLLARIQTPRRVAFQLIVD